MSLFKTFILCGAYMLVGPSLIFLNKYILSTLNFHYPIFLSGLGVLFSAIAAHAMVRSGAVSLKRNDQIQGFLWYKRVLPICLCHASTLAFGNTVYLLLNVGFIQMLKSFTPVIILLVGIVAQVESPNKPVILAIVIISLGTAATCSFTPDFNFLGILVMFSAELSEGIRLVLTQFLLQNLKFGVVEGQYVLAPASALCLFTASAFLEMPDMFQRNAFSIVFDYPMYFALASCMGLVVNFLSYYVIHATSSLTMKVLSTLRNILTIVGGVVMLKESVTLNELMGYAMALLGFVVYNGAKMGYIDDKFRLVSSKRPGTPKSRKSDNNVNAIPIGFDDGDKKTAMV